MNIKEFLGTTEVGVSAFISIVVAFSLGFVYLDERFARADDLKQLEQRVDVNELQTIYKTALENLYFYRSQTRKYPSDEDLKKKLKEAEEEVKDLKDLLKAAKTKKVKSVSNE